MKVKKMTMFDYYKYLYYRIYSWNLRTWGENDVPQFNALLGMTFLVFINIYVILMAIQLITKTDFFKLVDFKVVHAVVLGWGIGVINYFIFLYKQKYKQMAKQFSKEPENERNRRFIWCLAYAIFSLMSFFTLIILLS